MRILAWPGVPLALLSAALFGASTPLAKLLLGGIGPWTLAGLLYAGAGAGLLIVHLARRSLGIAAAEAPLRAADLPWMALVVLAGGVAGPVLLLLGLRVTPGATAALLLNLEGLATLAIAWLVFRENVDLKVGIRAAAILAGAAVLSWQGGADGAGAGALAIAAACLCWGIDNNLSRKLSSADPLQIAMIKGLAAGTVDLLLSRAPGEPWPPLAAVPPAAALGFVGYGVSLACFVLALRHLGAARTGAYFSSAPFIGALLAIPLLGEPVTPGLAGAAALMGLGLWLHLAERHDHEHAHEPLEHEHAHVHDDHHGHAHGPHDPPGEPHVHRHRHRPVIHRHPHYPDIHHRHGH